MEILKRQQLVKALRATIGLKPVNPEFPCSDGMRLAFAAAGLECPQGAWRQFNFFLPVRAAKAGDLHFIWSPQYKSVKHVLMDTGEGTVVHVMPHKPALEEPAASWLAHPFYRGARRHPAFARAAAEWGGAVEVAPEPCTPPELGQPMDHIEHALVVDGVVVDILPVDEAFIARYGAEHKRGRNGEWIKTPVKVARNWVYRDGVFKPW